MLHHVSFDVKDLKRAADFYDAALEPLNLISSLTCAKGLISTAQQSANSTSQQSAMAAQTMVRPSSTLAAITSKLSAMFNSICS